MYWIIWKKGDLITLHGITQDKASAGGSYNTMMFTLHTANGGVNDHISHPYLCDTYVTPRSARSGSNGSYTFRRVTSTNEQLNFGSVDWSTNCSSKNFNFSVLYPSGNTGTLSLVGTATMYAKYRKGI